MDKQYETLVESMKNEQHYLKNRLETISKHLTTVQVSDMYDYLKTLHSITDAAKRIDGLETEDRMLFAEILKIKDTVESRVREHLGFMDKKDVDNIIYLFGNCAVNGDYVFVNEELMNNLKEKLK